MNRILNVNVLTRFEDGDTPTYQRVWSDEEQRIKYSVSNMWDCPEDACIHRDLVSAYEWLDAIQLGMTLAREGYDGINIKNITWEPEEDE